MKNLEDSTIKSPRPKNGQLTSHWLKIFKREKDFEKDKRTIRGQQLTPEIDAWIG